LSGRRTFIEEPDAAWGVFEDPLEVVPFRDLKPHDSGEGCWCQPTLDDGVIVHHAMDLREQFEEGRKPS
jgi:hypothetical protein